MKSKKILESVKDKISKINDILKNKRIIIPIILAVVILIGVVSTLPILFNNYKTPIKFLEKYENSESYDIEDYIIDINGGLAKRELKQIWKTLYKSSYVKELSETFSESKSKEYNSYLDANPEYKVKLNIVKKEKLEKGDLSEYRKLYQNYVYDIQELVDETEEYTSSDWGYIAEEMDLLKDEAKDLIKGFNKLAKKYGRIEVSKGYSIELERIIDDGAPSICKVVVLKVNGKWMLAEDYRDYYITRNKLGFNSISELDLF